MSPREKKDYIFSLAEVESVLTISYFGKVGWVISPLVLRSYSQFCVQGTT